MLEGRNFLVFTFIDVPEKESSRGPRTWLGDREQEMSPCRHPDP